MSEDYERRIRNLERIVIGISAIVGSALAREHDEALEKVAEDFFYSVSDEGIKMAEMQFEPPDSWTNE